ncbi:MAG: hypothetical protein ACRCZI_04850 [Cetobacterium sp.]
MDANDGVDDDDDVEVNYAWRDHPLREFLEDELANHNIPIDVNEMGPMAVWNTYCDREDTADLFEGMVYGAAFKRRLAGLRRQVRGNLDRAAMDELAFETHRRNFPYQTFDAQGNRNWYGSKAEELLEEDMETGLYPAMKPSEIYATREEYQEFSLDVFRGHIHQYIATAKYIHTMKTIDEALRVERQKNREKRKKAAEKKAAKIAADVAKKVEQAAKQAAKAEKAKQKAAEKAAKAAEKAAKAAEKAAAKAAKIAKRGQT